MTIYTNKILFMQVKFENRNSDIKLLYSSRKACNIKGPGGGGGGGTHL